MPKIAIIGAGGVIFARRFITDILLRDSLKQSQLALMDISAERLQNTVAVTRRIGEALGIEPDIVATTDLEQALDGADYVLTIFRSGTLDHQRLEHEIPAKYGVDQVVADTLAPGGVFRALRVLPELTLVAETMARVCPNALLLNYVNPMSINVWALTKGTGVNMIGLCHGVQHTAKAMASYIGAPADEVVTQCVGVNHQAFFLRFEHEGQDAYPRLREAMNDPAIYQRDKVRFEIFRHFGSFCTEASGHSSEYVPYFRHRPDLIDEFCYVPEGEESTPMKRMSAGGSHAALEVCEQLQQNWRKSLERILSADQKPSLNRSEEYGVQIIEAIETGVPTRINGNVMNTNGLISNYPRECCVEVPCLIDACGVQPCAVGEMPEHLAGLNRAMITVQHLVANGFLNRDREMIVHALCHDPLTKAVCSLAEIRAMANDMFTAFRDVISPEFNA
jgi:alpha-galactosidase